MLRFALIAEGVSDQAVIENILYGYFDDQEILVQHSQPLPDPSGRLASSAEHGGGFGQVFNYCRSSKFLRTLTTNDYVIVQIDTDRAGEWGDQIIWGKDEPVTEFVAAVQRKIAADIGTHYDTHKERILFAVSVHSIECWLLPLYIDRSRKVDRKAITNCHNKLYRWIEAGDMKRLRDKEPAFYDKVSELFWKKPSQLLEAASEQESLQIFLDRLGTIEKEGG